MGATNTNQTTSTLLDDADRWQSFFDNLSLKRGAHSPGKELCLLEAAAYIAGESHTDHPACVDVALAAYGRKINDRLGDEERQLLKPLLPKLVGTRGTYALAVKRAYLLVDRTIRSHLPAFLRALPGKPHPDLAERFEALDPITSKESAIRARDLAREVRAILYSAAAYDAAAYAAYAAYDAAAYAAYDAYAAAAAYAADAAAEAADAAYADAAAWKQLRSDMIARSIATFAEAIALTEEA